MRLVFSILFVAFLLTGVAAQEQQDKDDGSSIKTTAATTATGSTTSIVTIKMNTTANTASTPSINTTTTNFNDSTPIDGTDGTEINSITSTQRPQIDIGSAVHLPSKVKSQKNMTVITVSTPSTNTTTTYFDVSTTINGTNGTEINSTTSTQRSQVDSGSDGHPPSKVGMQIALGVGIPIILIIVICGVCCYCGRKFCNNGDNVRSLPLIKKSAKENNEKSKLLEDQVSQDKPDQPFNVENQSTRTAQNFVDSPSK